MCEIEIILSGNQTHVVMCLLALKSNQKLSCPYNVPEWVPFDKGSQNDLYPLCKQNVELFPSKFSESNKSTDSGTLIFIN